MAGVFYCDGHGFAIDNDREGSFVARISSIAGIRKSNLRCAGLEHLRGWSRFAGLQIEYNQLIPMGECVEYLRNRVVAPGSGVLTGKYHDERLMSDKKRQLHRRSCQERRS